MRNFLVGLIVGGCITSLVHWFSAERAATGNSVGPTASAAVSPPQPPDASLPAAADAAAAASSAPGPQTPARPGATSANHLSPARPPVALPPLSIPPASLSEEHRTLIGEGVKPRHPSVGELHRQLTREPKEGAWSTEAELALRQFLAQQATSPGFDVVTVDCRVSLCELQVFGNAPGSDERWNTLVDAMIHQPWWSLFGGSSTSSASQNGRAVILTILQRRAA